jgi:CRISPR-associated protein Cmr2
LLGEENEEWLKRLLHRDVWKRPLEFAKHAAAVLSQRGHKSLLGGRESLYGPSHAMAQRMLAAGKSIPIDERAPEPGIKCSMHGDLEILHCDWKSDEDRNPPAATDPFWKEVRKGWKIKSDFKSSERLSSVGLMKRIAYRVCQESPAHPLKPFFRDGQGFPSTTEMAMADWLDRVEKSGLDRLILAVSREWRKVLAQVVHGLEPEGDETEHEIIELEEQKRKAGLEVIRQMDQMKDPLTDEDRYYAILLMDGDRMGRLVNGETLAAAWRSVMHPVLCSRLQEEGFDRVYQDFWKAHLDEPRIIAPAVHAAISEALGDFALYSVPGIMKAHRGKLIYAGGDDVCAILPVSEALEAAREIAEAYNHGFLVFYKDRPGSPEILRDTWTPGPGRLAVHLGKGECISISAGILICHHKKPLSVAMRRAHDDVLKKMAKNEGRRNALAVVLEKRAGGDRSFVTKWEEKPWHELQLQSWGAPDIPMLDHFNAIAEALGRPNASALSTSLVYRLHEFRDGLKAIAETAPQQLVPFIRTQIERSGERSEEDEENAETLACHVAAITARCKVGAARPLIDPEALVIARFIGRLRSRHRLTTGGEQ